MQYTGQSQRCTPRGSAVRGRATSIRNSPSKERYNRAEDTEGHRKFPQGDLTAVKNFAEYLAPGELASFDDLKPGSGAVVRQGLSKIAAYRDKSGVLYLRSAACTHIGCHLHWNSFERVGTVPVMVHNSPLTGRR